MSVLFRALPLSVLILSGRSEWASNLLSVLARKSESGAVSCFILAGDGYHPPAFGVLERNLLASSGPTEFRQWLQWPLSVLRGAFSSGSRHLMPSGWTERPPISTC